MKINNTSTSTTSPVETTKPGAPPTSTDGADKTKSSDTSSTSKSDDSGKSAAPSNPTAEKNAKLAEKNVAAQAQKSKLESAAGSLLGGLADAIGGSAEKVTSALGEVAKKAGDAIERHQTIQDLGDKAEKAGLSAKDAGKLRDNLGKYEGSDFARESKLVQDALGSKNPDRALRTYNDLQPIRDANGKRVTPEVTRDLVMGVGRSRTNASAGREGILGQDQAVRAAKTLASMPKSEYDAIKKSMDDAGKGGSKHADAQTERGLILKAVAARKERYDNPGILDRLRMAVGKPHSATTEVTEYADDIQGMKRSKLIRNSSVLDLDGDKKAEALQQRFNDSCAPTTGQMAQAEADPVYALKLHEEAIHSTRRNTDIGDQQKTRLTDHGGVPTKRGTPGLGVWTEDTVNDHVSPVTGHNYTRTSVANTAASRTTAVDKMETILRKGRDVPIEFAWNGGGAHAMLISDVRGSGASQKFLLTDPWTGKTTWLNRTDLINGNTKTPAGTGRLRTIIE